MYEEWSASQNSGGCNSPDPRRQWKCLYIESMHGDRHSQQTAVGCSDSRRCHAAGSPLFDVRRTVGVLLQCVHDLGRVHVQRHHPVLGRQSSRVDPGRGPGHRSHQLQRTEVLERLSTSHARRHHHTSSLVYRPLFQNMGTVSRHQNDKPLWVSNAARDDGDGGSVNQNSKRCKYPLRSPLSEYQRRVILNARCPSCRPIHVKVLKASPLTIIVYRDTFNRFYYKINASVTKKQLGHSREYISHPLRPDGLLCQIVGSCKSNNRSELRGYNITPSSPRKPS